MVSIPSDIKKARACLVCASIKTFDQFVDEGCDNCEAFLALRGDGDRVLDCTTSSFYGAIAMLAPAESWVSRWKRLQDRQKGLYAIKVTGTLPEELEDDLERRGITAECYQAQHLDDDDTDHADLADS